MSKKAKESMTPSQEVYYLLTLFSQHSFNDQCGKHYDDYSEYESDSKMLQTILDKMKQVCNDEDERLNPEWHNRVTPFSEEEVKSTLDMIREKKAMSQLARNEKRINELADNVKTIRNVLVALNGVDIDYKELAEQGHNMIAVKKLLRDSKTGVPNDE